jgi:PAP_fibrillin
VRTRASSGLLQWAQSLSKRPEESKARQQLLTAIDGTSRGVQLGARPAVEAAVDSLAALSSGDNAQQCSGVWRLLWTSERETLFLLQSGLPFVGAAGESYQVIDVQAGTLSNIILFDDDRAAFVVRARCVCARDSRVRTSFNFTSAELHVPGRDAPFILPPFGSGWFDSLYLSDHSGSPQLRVARDSRGDTLVVERCRNVKVPFV